MSSLKDIMDVDVEPLESQAYRRSREAAQQQASRPTITPIPETPSPPVDEEEEEEEEEDNNNKGKGPIKRRRSNRVSRSSGIPTLSRANVQQRRDSVAGEMSRASESGADIPVKYTPVTGRISRAKKGVPVHTCDICRPAKTFTRAEHLRRHQLSHQKPAYACTFEDCERAFHRPDLLARHMHRHETQGEKAYKASDPRSSRASSDASENPVPSLKLEPSSQGPRMSASQASPTDTATPRTTSGESSITASSSSTIVPHFQPVNFSGSGNHKRKASDAGLPESGSYVPPSPGSSRPPVSYDEMNPGSFTRTTELPDQGNFPRPTSSFDIFGGDSSFSNYTTTAHQLPLLRIPEETFIPALSYPQDNSPWCSSSASDSTFSNHSETSRSRHWVPRARSTSIADWPVSAAPSQWSSHSISTPQDMRSPPFETILEQYETPYTSPRISPPTSQSQLLDVPNAFGGYYSMESVGTPTLSTYIKPMSQVFSASPSRVSDPGLAVINAPREREQLGALHTSMALASKLPQQPQLDAYLNSYWQYFHPLFPIIHRPTFNSADDPLLCSAMVAIGTQYHNTPEARTKGSELNESCRRHTDEYTTWELPIMQAILLTEVFSRFRGRKTQVRLSRQFENLYDRLFNSSNSADSLLDHYGTQINEPDLHHSDLTSEWFRWSRTEARQRLLSACFMFDIHQSHYHQQPRSKALGGALRPNLFNPCPESLWNASTASEWQSHQSDSIPNEHPLDLLDNDSTQQILPASPFTQSLLICSLATQLPARQNPMRPNQFNPHLTASGLGSLATFFSSSLLAQTYLALYYTPLHDLLAIAGDTWIFAQKITPPSAFHDAQARLKKWVTTPAAAHATKHACHILSSNFSRPYADMQQGQTNGSNALSDYWSLYVAALICWAFGHRFQTSNNGNGTTIRNHAISTTDVEDASPIGSADEARIKAITYANEMLKLNVDDLLTNRANMKGDTSSVIHATRHYLELESVGGKSSILVDCIGVLKKISKSGRVKWF
ncbi:hypothetical protein G7Y89_g252 [Cudoniella acicularis]|uniref:C2H2-type domain-containing protein n=1 Tax=Cudoniella acicularis TaxID=354080 RepID=A0A8H4RYD9_9HELO|nr:hypothetical protein G7Y89_g252 [Cudoniella acicularis]